MPTLDQYQHFFNRPEVIHKYNLTEHELHILHAINFYCRNGSSCKINANILCESSNCLSCGITVTEKDRQFYIRLLEEKKIIYVKRKKGFTNEYKIIIPILYSVK